MPSIRGSIVVHMKLIVQIPALNEEKTIAAVIEGIPRTLEGIDAIVLLVVDDGSSDETARIAEASGAIVVRHPRNLGLGKSFQSGMARALDLGADLVVTVDGDGQFPTKDIPKLIDPILSGRADFVTATRFRCQSLHPQGIPWIKKWGNGVVARIISRLSGGNFTDVSCGFRAYSRKALLKLNLFGDFTYTHETFLNIANADLTIEEVPVQVTYFPERRSRIAHSVIRYGYRTIWIIFRTFLDHRPFVVFSTIALLFALVALVCAAVPGVNYITTGEFSPYKFLAFISGFLMAISILVMCIGLVSDILNRLRITQERLLYEFKTRNLK